MKRLNKKGFTLIELLAVIVVLAIVMVIATVTILNSTRNAAVNSFNSSALTVADFVKQQESLYVLGTGNAETCYDNWRSTNSGNGAHTIGSGNSACFGLNDTDYDLTTSQITIGANNVVTVKLCSKTGGKFDNITSVSGITVDSNKCVSVKK